MLTAISQDNSKTPVGGKSQQGKTGAAGALSKKKNRLEVEKEDDGQPSPKLVPSLILYHHVFYILRNFQDKR